MFRDGHRLHRSPGSPPDEGILSNVLGEFLDPIDALFTIFSSAFSLRCSSRCHMRS